MDEKIEKGLKLLEKGYKAEYEKPIISIPGIHNSKLTLTSPEGNCESIEFTGMEVSAADKIFFDYLTNNGDY